MCLLAMPLTGTAMPLSAIAVPFYGVCWHWMIMPLSRPRTRLQYMLDSVHEHVTVDSYTTIQLGTKNEQCLPLNTLIISVKNYMYAFGNSKCVILTPSTLLELGFDLLIKASHHRLWWFRS